MAKETSGAHSFFSAESAAYKLASREKKEEHLCPRESHLILWYLSKWDLVACCLHQNAEVIPQSRISLKDKQVLENYFSHAEEILVKEILVK